MAFKISHTLCTVLLLWVSVSAKLYTFTGKWQGEMKKCDNEGGNSRDYEFNIGTLASIKLPYAEVDNRTFVVAEGEMRFNTTTIGYRMERTLDLNGFDEEGDTKVFSNILGIGGTNFEQMQMGTLHLDLTIFKSGQVTLKQNVYAESWNATGCCHLNSTISKITMNV